MGVTGSAFEGINVIRRGMTFPALERTWMVCKAKDGRVENPGPMIGKL